MPKQKKSKSRRADALRPVRFLRRFTDTPAGSVLVEMGRTKVLCTASLESGLPKWRQDSQLGWVTAEYGMLPGSTSPRKPRSRSSYTDSRGLEISRLIGRTMRAVIDFEKLGPNTINLDCDVLQADGGTRTAAINGSYVALVDAVRSALQQKLITANPINAAVAAVSVGLIAGKTVLDLDYRLDSTADVDLNVAMLDDGSFVELQGTGEQTTFTGAQLDSMLALAQRGIKKILTAQKQCLTK